MSTYYRQQPKWESPRKARAPLGFSSRLLRSVASVTMAAMLWLTVSPAMAATTNRNAPQGHTRRLSLGEMRVIVGGQPGSRPTLAPLDPEAGSPYSWEGSAPTSSGSLNTGNGNKLTELPIASWKVKGGRLAVDFSLYHNSQSAYNNELAQKWTHSYNLFVVEGTSAEGSPVSSVHFGNDLANTYVRSGSTCTAPAGVYNTLIKTGTGTSAVYDLTSKEQIKYRFTSSDGVTWYCQSIKDRNNNTITLGHDAGGNVTSVSDGTRTLTLTYASGRISSITDPASRVWTITYNGSGDLTQVAYPLLAGDATVYKVQYGYNTAHDITSLTDRRGKVWTFGYNSGNGLISETDPLNHATTYVYTSSTTTITDPNNHATVHTYASGRLASVKDAALYTESYAYNALNQKTQVTDKRSKIWIYTYDSKGNVLTKKNPLLKVWTYTYNTKNDVLTATTPLSKQTTYGYDTAGNCTSVTDPNSKVTTLTYNTDGTLYTKKDSNNHTTTYYYDANGNLTGVTTPGAKATTWTYNTLGKPLTRLDPLGRTTTSTYDNWQRLSAKSFTASGSASQSFAYNANDNLTSFTDGTGTTTRAYDDEGRMTSEAKSAGTISYTYDATGKIGLLSTVSDAASRTITYAYTVRNQIASVADGSGTTSYSYDAGGNETGITNGNGTLVVTSYDDASHLASVINKSPGGTTTLSSFTYGYRDDDKRNSVTELGGSVVSYTYDNAGRLTGEGRTGTTSYSASYTLDGEGNRTSQTVGSATTGFTYDTDDALTVASTTTGGLNNTYGYNGNGEQTTRTLSGVSYTLSYDGDGQLISLVNGGNAVTYAYDAAGRRASRTAGGVTTTYLYGPGGILLEKQGVSYTAKYTYGNALVGKASEAHSRPTCTMVRAATARQRTQPEQSPRLGRMRGLVKQSPARAGRPTAMGRPAATGMTGMQA